METLLRIGCTKVWPMGPAAVIANLLKSEPLIDGCLEIVEAQSL